MPLGYYRCLGLLALFCLGAALAYWAIECVMPAPVPHEPEQFWVCRSPGVEIRPYAVYRNGKLLIRTPHYMQPRWTNECPGIPDGGVTE